MDLFSYLLGKQNSGGGSSEFDWSAIGYSETPQGIVDAYNYALGIKNNWDATRTSLSNKFKNDKQLTFMPLVDTSNATTTYGMFEGCNTLVSVPLLNTSNVNNMANMFKSCYVLKEIPSLDTSNVTSINNTFNACYSLTTLPQLDFSSVTNIQNAFVTCTSLTDTSLNNILLSCIGMTSYTGTKTLLHMGFNITNYPASRIQALPNYQDFINAGWTIGY